MGGGAWSSAETSSSEACLPASRATVSWGAIRLEQSGRVTHTLQMTDQCGMHTAFGKPVVPELKERRASFVFWSSAFI